MQLHSLMSGGAAFADVQTSLGVSCLSGGCGNGTILTAGVETINVSQYKTGWVAGAGVEWMFLPNWMLRAEYLRIDLGNLSNTTNPTPCFFENACSLSWSRDLRYDVVRAGISYKFGGPAPAAVATRY